MKVKANQRLAAVLMPCCLFLGVFFLTAAPRHAPAQAGGSSILLRVDRTQSRLQWVLGTTLHTVHGTFAAKGGTVRVDLSSGKVAGEIVVLATTGDSGNGARDRRMHREVLESERFPDVSFRPDRIDGKLTLEGASDFGLHGMFFLHGTGHELSIPVHAELNGDHWAGSTKFNIPFVDWGLKDPSNFLLKVKREVEIELQLKGSLENVAEPKS